MHKRVLVRIALLLLIALGIAGVVVWLRSMEHEHREKQSALELEFKDKHAALEKEFAQKRSAENQRIEELESHLRANHAALEKEREQKQSAENQRIEKLDLDLRARHAAIEKEFERKQTIENQRIEKLERDVHDKHAAMVREFEQKQLAENQRVQKHEALRFGLKVAVDHKDRGEWGTVVAALQQPVTAIGDEPDANLELAQSILNQARKELARRSEFEACLRNGQQLLSDEKFDESIKAFEQAIAVWPDSPQVAEARTRIETARNELRKRDEFSANVKEGKARYERHDWDQAARHFAMAEALWPDAPEISSIIALHEGAFRELEKDKAFKAQIERTRQDVEEKQQHLKADAESAQRDLEWEKSWPYRGTQAARNTLGSLAAADLLSLTHPTGSNPKIGSIDAFVDGGTVKANVRLQWKGGFTGASYTTAINWSFNKDGHMSATVTSDDAAIQVDEEHRRMLDQYFRQLFATVKNNADRR